MAALFAGGPVFARGFAAKAGCGAEPTVCWAAVLGARRRGGGGRTVALHRVPARSLPASKRDGSPWRGRHALPLLAAAAAVTVARCSRAGGALPLPTGASGVLPDPCRHQQRVHRHVWPAKGHGCAQKTPNQQLCLEGSSQGQRRIRGGSGGHFPAEHALHEHLLPASLPAKCPP